MRVYVLVLYTVPIYPSAHACELYTDILTILRQGCIAHWLLQLWPISLESTTHSPWKGRPFRPASSPGGLSILLMLPTTLKIPALFAKNCLPEMILPKTQTLLCYVAPHAGSKMIKPLIDDHHMCEIYDNRAKATSRVACNASFFFEWTFYPAATYFV